MIKKLNESDALKFKTLSPEEKQKKGVLGRLFGPVASCIHATRNGRAYSEQLWEKLFNSDIIKERFQSGGIFGQLCHPDYEEVDMEKIACVMPEPPVKDKNGNLVAYVDILDTPCGKIAYQLAKYGYKFGISSRGTGDLIDGMDGEEVDPDTYQLNAFDLVEVPAVKEARLQFVESLDNKKSGLGKALTTVYNKAGSHEKELITESLESLGISLTEGDLQVGDKVKVKVDNNREGEVTEIKGDQVYVEMPDDGKNPAREDSYYEQDLEKLNESTTSDDFKELSGRLYDSIETYVHNESPFDVDDAKRKDNTEENTTTIEIELDTESYDDYYKPDHYGDPYKWEVYQDNLDDEVGMLAQSLKYDFKAIDYDHSGKTITLWYDEILNESLTESAYKDYVIEPAYFGKGFTVFYEGDEVYFQTEEEAKQFIDEVSDEANESLTEDMIDGSKSLNELVADVEESMDESPEDKQDKEVVNDKSDELVAELKESLNKNKTLEADNLSLQEQLSVCNAKEAELREQLARYKQATVKLSDKAKEVKPIKESLNEKDKTIANNKKQIKSLSESLKVSKAELDSIKDSKQSAESEIEKLNQSVATLTENLDKITKQLESSKLLVEKYKVSYKALKESYLTAKSESCGLHPELVLQNLNESYKIRDIDEVCKKLSKQKSTIDKLPFRINESTKISVKKADEYINGNNSYNADDEVSGYLLNLVDLK